MLAPSCSTHCPGTFDTMMRLTRWTRNGFATTRQALHPRKPVQQLSRRHQSSSSPPSDATARASRIDRITARLPRRLQKYTNGLRDAPVSHVVSFLVLHELTAIVPLLGLFALFHYTTWVPVAYVTEHFGGSVQAGVARFERYFSRKGWFGFGEEDGTGAERRDGDGEEHAKEVMERLKRDEGKYRILGEVALAYALTKALLPVRIIGTVWATPWFAGVMLRARRALTRTK